mgnify:CR=1 FL=1
MRSARAERSTGSVSLAARSPERAGALVSIGPVRCASSMSRSIPKPGSILSSFSENRRRMCFGVRTGLASVMATELTSPSARKA